MALKFHPNPGAVLLCDYQTGFVAPEMVKVRPVVVITPRLRNRASLCTVVPLSTTAPEHIEAYHCEIRLIPKLPSPYDSESCWVKADMLATVSHDRLSPIKVGKDRFNNRVYYNTLLKSEVLRQIQRSVLWALNLGHLTRHL